MQESILLPRYLELIEQAVNWDYGSIHNHKEVADTMNLNPGTGEYYRNVNAANKKLLESGKKLVNIKDKGYQVLSPDDYAKESARKVEQGKKRIKQAHKVLTYAPVESMSEDGKRRFTTFSDRLSAFSALVQGASVELKMLAAQKPRIRLSENQRQ